MVELEMKQISLSEAKERFSEILQRVASGESFMITIQGKPIADVVPSRSNDRSKIQTTIDKILSSRRHAISDHQLATFRRKDRI